MRIKMSTTDTVHYSFITHTFIALKFFVVDYASNGNMYFVSKFFFKIIPMPNHTKFMGKYYCYTASCVGGE